MSRQRTADQVQELSIEVADMYDGGLAVKEIAAEVGVSVTYVYKLLEKQGVDATGVRGSFLDALDQEVIDEIVANYQSRTVPMSHLLEAHGLSYSNMYAILLSQGVSIRRHINKEEVTRKLRMETAVQMYIDGARLWLIKEETGIHQPQLHAELHKRNVKLRRENGVTRPLTGIVRHDRTGDDPDPL